MSLGMRNIRLNKVLAITKQHFMMNDKQSRK